MPPAILGSMTGGLVLLHSLASWGCVPNDEGVPGNSQGSHLWQGRLSENTCGPSAVPADDEIEMRVQLRRDGALAVWRRPGSPLMLGSIESDESWRLNFSTTVNVYEFDPLTGRGPCSFEQVETIRFAPVEPEESTDPEMTEDQELRFVGTSVTRWYPSPGTDCSASLAIVGGPFFDLPCEVEYAIQSTPIDSIFAAEQEEEEEVEDNTL
ncbi:MAG: hypothetical protein ACI9KE_003568 [Polyangiales bacterium]